MWIVYRPKSCYGCVSPSGVWTTIKWFLWQTFRLLSQTSGVMFSVGYQSHSSLVVIDFTVYAGHMHSAATAYAMAMCLSVGLSVRSSQAGVLSKRLNASSYRSNSGMVWKDCCSFKPEILAKLQWSHRQWGTKCTWGRKTCVFDQYSLYVENSSS